MTILLLVILNMILGTFFNHRIFHIEGENDNYILMHLSPGINSISMTDHVIIFGGEDGRIKKICFDLYDRFDESSKTIDKQYFVI